MLETLQLPVPSTSAMVTYNQELRRTTGTLRINTHALERPGQKRCQAGNINPGATWV